MLSSQTTQDGAFLEPRGCNQVASSAGSPRAADGQQTPEFVSGQPCGGRLRSDGRTASITPEVAGSSPVAPVKSCKLAYVFDIMTAGFFSPRADPARESA